MTIEITAKDIEGIEPRFNIDRYPDCCPLCHHHIEPKRMGVAYVKGTGLSTRLQICFRCPRRDCQSLFLGTYKDKYNARTLYLEHTAPFTPESPEHPEEIEALSPSFVEIYTQAAHAEWMNLDQIAGMGYRKALEFLVKDFAIKQRPDDEQQIKDTLLGTVINNYVDDVRVKSTASRAAWLGNDESHYLRKWEDKDIQDLKNLIQLARNAIHNVLLADRYEEEMKKRK